MKFVFIILIVMFTVTDLFSQNNNSVQEDDFLLVQMLISKDLARHKHDILQHSQNLTPAQKMFIMSDRESKAGIPFVVNLVAGFGIGSWIQGDDVGGIIGTVGETSGLLLMIMSEESAPLGAILYLTSYITDLILPWTYASSYNSDLRYALGDPYYSHISITPTAGRTYDNHTYAGAKLSISF